LELLILNEGADTPRSRNCESVNAFAQIPFTYGATTGTPIHALVTALNFKAAKCTQAAVDDQSVSALTVNRVPAQS
jgi:hypothetical protein